MKKFKEFRAEQQYVDEAVGPVGAALMGVMGMAGLGFAGYKLFKKAKEGIKGYKETKQEKKDNKEAGVFIDKKVYDPETGETKTETIPLHPPGSSKAKISNDDVEKERKKEQKKEDRKNKVLKFKRVEAEKLFKKDIEGGKVLKYDKASGKYSVEDPPPEETEPPEDETGTDDTQTGTDDTQTGQKDDEVDRDEEGNIKNQKDAQAAFEKGGMKQAPDGWTKDPNDKKKVIKPEDIKKKSNTQGNTSAPRGALKNLAKKQGLSSQNILSFGEFISEDVMKDLKKASKSKKDSEISLDDGSAIPIDPLTSEILVKYIEGLGSSEKNRTIKQIQRTERAFMKVLGKAHEG